MLLAVSNQETNLLKTSAISYQIAKHFFGKCVEVFCTCPGITM